MTGADRRYFKQLRDAYERDRQRLKQQVQQAEIAMHEIERGLKHIDSVLGVLPEEERIDSGLATSL